MITFVECGNIWNDFDKGASIAHGCNLQGVMGAGVAYQVGWKFPDLFKKYQVGCKTELWGLGDIYPYRVQDSPVQTIYNLMTQWDTKGASYDGVWHSLCRLNVMASADGVPLVSLPALGAGLGRLNWPVVKTMLNEIFSASSVEVIVYENYCQ